jgi:hypothetical protein
MWRADSDRRVAAARRTLVAHLRAQQTTIGERIVAEMRRSLPAYEAMSASDQRQVAQAVEVSVKLVLSLWQKPRTLTDLEKDLVHAMGAERSVMGVSQPDMVGGVELAHRAGWRIAILEAQRLLNRMLVWLTPEEAIELMGNLSLELADAVAAIRDGMTAGYLSAARARREAHAHLYGDVLRGAVPTEEHAARRAAAAGIDLHAPTGLFLIARPGFEAVTAGQQNTPTAIVDTLPGSFTVARPTFAVAHEIVVVPCTAAQAWDDLVAVAQTHAASATIVPVRPVGGALALRAAYIDGLKALRLALVRHGRGGRLVNSSSVAFVGLLSDAAPQSREQLLAPLRALLRLTNANELIDTMSALLRHRGVTSAARELNLHRNTVMDRRAQIEACTGLLLDDVDDRLSLSAALYLHRLGANVKG